MEGDEPPTPLVDAAEVFSSFAGAGRQREGGGQSARAEQEAAAGRIVRPVLGGGPPGADLLGEIHRARPHVGQRRAVCLLHVPGEAGELTLADRQFPAGVRGAHFTAPSVIGEALVVG